MLEVMTAKTDKTRSRGSSVRLNGLSATVNRKLRRAVALDGWDSISEWALNAALDFISEQSSKHGDLMTAMTPLERRVIKVVASGAALYAEIKDESMIADTKLRPILEHLVERKVLEIRKQRGVAGLSRRTSDDLYVVSDEFTASETKNRTADAAKKTITDE